MLGVLQAELQELVESNRQAAAADEAQGITQISAQ